MLAKHLPIAQVLVRQIDPPRIAWRPWRWALPCPAGPGATPAGNAPLRQWSSLSAWCKLGKAVHGRRRRRAELETVAPAGVEEDVLAGPLPLPDGRWAVLVLIAPPQQTSSRDTRNWLQLLLEPFSIALGNHHRLSEMAALRKAAEADKRSLLSRLGRSKLGDTIVGVESGLQAVMERVELVARSDVPVLIFGETGSGKELVARAIHNRSPRAAGPFIRVNCSAIPHELIDSQLFGHEKGAFTGAVEARKGWFERADGGTLLLDELGELTLAAQVRLLRVLQDGWLDRVGSQRPMSVDVRIVAATHRDLAAMVAEGKFREDLWYRIAVFPIRLPPLRERTRRHRRVGAAFRRPGRHAVRPLSGHAQRRRLDAVEGICLAGERPRVGHGDRPGGDPWRRKEAGGGHGVGHWRASLGLAGGAGFAIGLAANTAGQAGAAARPPQTIVSLDAAMREHIERALAAAGGRIEGPAARRGCCKSIPTPCARMRKLKIDWDRFRQVPPGQL